MVDQRKTVSVVFADLVESSSLAERLDPEVLAGVLRRYFSALRAVIEKHGGTVEKFIGDAVVGVFGVPMLHEDDALRAVKAALEIQAAVDRLNDDLGHSAGTSLQVTRGREYRRGRRIGRELARSRHQHGCAPGAECRGRPGAHWQANPRSDRWFSQRRCRRGSDGQRIE